jgi:putative flippase GtrA
MLELLRGKRQFLLYLCGGVASALIDVGLMQLLITTGAHYALAASAGFFAGLAFNYAFHARITFNHTPTGRSFTRYIALVALNYGFTLGCVALGVKLGAPAVAGKIVSLPLVAVNGYLLGKHWIFRQH